MCVTRRDEIFVLQVSFGQRLFSFIIVNRRNMNICHMKKAADPSCLRIPGTYTCFTLQNILNSQCCFLTDCYDIPMCFFKVVFFTYEFTDNCYVKTNALGYFC